MQPQRLRLQRIAQRGFQRQPLLRLAVHLRAEERNAVTARRLGLVHRHVGMAQQRVHVTPVLREDTDADTGRRIQRNTAHRERLGKRQQNVFRGRGQPAVLELRHQHHELVAGEPAHDIRRTRQTAQTLRHIAQQRIADRVAQRIVDLLEAVQIQEQHRNPLAFRFGARDRLLGLRQQQIPVGQPRQLVVERQLANARTRFLALQRQRAQIDAHIHQPVMEIIRQAAFAKIETESADHPAVAGLDGRRPARLDVLGQRQMPVIVPQRIRRDVRHDHRTPQKRGGAAGARLRTDRHAVQRIRIRLRQAGGRQRPQQAGVVHAQHRGRHLGRQAFDLAANHVHDLDHRGLIDHGLQHAALQNLMHLGGRDVRQHIHDVDQRAAVVEHRIGHHGNPQRLAATVVDQHVLVVALAAGDAPVQFLARAAVGPAAGQQFAQVLVHRVAARKSQHALEAIVHVNDAPIAAGHGHRVAGFIDAQQQQADFFLPFGIGNRLARNHRDAADFARIVQHGQVGRLDPERATVLLAVAARAGEVLPAAQPRPDPFAAGDALALVHAVAQHIVAQGRDFVVGIAHRGQKICVGVQQGASCVEVEQQKRPVHRRQVIVHLPRGAFGGRARTAKVRIKHKGLHTG
ncbi:hypothetical protein D3C85_523160 [compost metagenome]